MATGINFRSKLDSRVFLKEKFCLQLCIEMSLALRGWQATWRQCVYLSQVSSAPGLVALDAKAVAAPATRNNSVQTASLQCFSVISMRCKFVTLGPINEKVIDLKLRAFCRLQ